MSSPHFFLKNGHFKDLFDPLWLAQQDARFLAALKSQKAAQYDLLMAYRKDPASLEATAISDLVIDCAPVLETYISDLFGITDAVCKAQIETRSHDCVFTFKNWYVKRQARRNLRKSDALPAFSKLQDWLQNALATHNIAISDLDIEKQVAKLGVDYLSDEARYHAEIEQLINWCVLALTDPEGQIFVKDWVSFRLPQKRDYDNLVKTTRVPGDQLARLQGAANNRARDGFGLTDPRFSQREVLSEVDYCVYCHEKSGDFCAKGFPTKKGQPQLGLKKNPLEEVLTGCPLEEKISEMHALKQKGYTIAALAVMMIDNPLCPMTGHRICNDCMKACIYQKQDPVDIPQVETGILTDVLSLPWGVEVYDLLTRWNPLRPVQWVAKPYNGLKVLIMGTGPAGFALAHHLLMSGCAVTGVDGLKIEPLPDQLLQSPIYSYESIKEPLGDRIMTGFGGVAEYGITVRWDKNFLKLIYISLMRRPYFQVFGGIRFGGTLTVEDAWRLGFDHLAIAVGAGLPKALPIPGSMAPGMRQANDFLMALQLTGAAKKSSLANLQVRLPAVVIGGGLTGIDTATEVQAYYITQVEKACMQYAILSQELGEARLRSHFSPYHLEILDEFLAHGQAVQQEREQATREGRSVNFTPLIRKWGGVTVVYRRRLCQSPAYLRNHDEVIKALEEGIYYAEGLAPQAVLLDDQGHVRALVCQSRILDEKGEWVISDEQHVVPGRAIFVATGAAPNIAYTFEHAKTFHKKAGMYARYDSAHNLQTPDAAHHVKTDNLWAFTSYQGKNQERVTVLGDTHPVFHGSVVKALASAKRIYPHILQLWGARAHKQADLAKYADFAQKIKKQFAAHVIKVVRHTASVVEIYIKAPLAAYHFRPGHFYRLQNFETHARRLQGTLLQTESTALLGCRVNKQSGTLSLMVLERGVSSRLFATLQPNDPVALMGPSGVHTKIPSGEIVLIVGGRLAAAQLLSLGPILQEKGNTVFFIGGFDAASEVFCQSDLEQATDKIIWATGHGPVIPTHRAQDHSMTGDALGALLHYAEGKLAFDPPDIRLSSVNRVLVIGSLGLIRGLHLAKSDALKLHFAKDVAWIAACYGPMQCMLKGVCAQCLVWQVDPVTKARTKAVFACSWQHQPFDWIDLDNLEERLAQNQMQETLSNLWLDHIFAHNQIDRV